VLTVGLPVERHERLLKVDRLRDADSLTAWFLCYFQASGDYHRSTWQRIRMGIVGFGGCGVPFKVAELQAGEKA